MTCLGKFRVIFVLRYACIEGKVKKPNSFQRVSDEVGKQKK